MFADCGDLRWNRKGIGDTWASFPAFPDLFTQIWKYGWCTHFGHRGWGHEKYLDQKVTLGIERVKEAIGLGKNNTK